MNIFQAYFAYATAIFIIHLLLFAACGYCLVREYLLLRDEGGYEVQRKSRIPSLKSGSETMKLSLLADDLSRKGQPLNADALRWRLLRYLNPYDSITRFCLNAFVVSGLLGTLYNLWRLGPEFWASLLKGASGTARAAAQGATAAQAGQPAIGLAFAASVFGLSAALFVSWLDSFLIRYPRERFVNAAAAAIFANAAKLVPPTEGAAVAQALDSFYRSSDSFLNKLRIDHEKLSAQFTKQVQDSSADLVRTLDKIGGEWQALSKTVADDIRQNQSQMGDHLRGLGNAVAKTEETLAAALPNLAEAEKLAAKLNALRAEAASLQGQIATKFGEYSNKWREDLDQMTSSHVARMEEVYRQGWSQYSKESGDWHEKSVGALDGFATNIGASVSKWSEEREQARRQIDEMMNDWRKHLSTSLTGLGAGLADLNKEVQGLVKNSTQLATFNEEALRQLRELQSAVASFNVQVLRDTPLGSAIDNFDITVRELKDAVAGININVSAPPTPYPGGQSDDLMGQILREVRRLAASVEGAKGQVHSSERYEPREWRQDIHTHRAPSETQDEPAPESRTRRLLRRLHLRR